MTVISSTFKLGFGDRIDVMKGETTLQFHGVGPYDIHYVDPADDPRAALAAQ